MPRVRKLPGLKAGNRTRGYKTCVFSNALQSIKKHKKITHCADTDVVSDASAVGVFRLTETSFDIPVSSIVTP